MPQQQGSCSRLLSREARHVIDTLFAANLEHVPADCPLITDIYAKQEASKTAVRQHVWSCGFCGKKFTSEEYIDRHMNNKHQEELLGDSHCAANLCDVFGGCESHQVSCSAERGFDSGLQSRRHMCSSLLHRCFSPRGGEAMAQVHDTLMVSICDNIECSERGQLYVARDAASSVRTRTRVGRPLLWLLTGVALLIFYGVLSCMRGDSGRRKDLRRFRPKGRKQA